MEERNITVDIKTAREWYNSSNDTLKTLALKAFTEKELQTPFPKSWEEFIRCKTNVPLSVDETKACRALSKLINLRNAWWRADGNWKPDWCDGNQLKYCIDTDRYNVKKDEWTHTGFILTFRTARLRDEFLATFRDLIEEAKMFL